ncbi:MFS transporter [Actinoplanes couchii]|uniref:MFS transporter n=1 Tax=Actinoplanes couchii TaxID=403638 RepID=A0ABQ3XNE9_9ACTN|nr:hypothetical protein [Actinoplanes couchii]MDR6318159.1 MFS family permease [Actinoplanes couchii]GID59925.1 hypothetical protein Aco03nite_083290 [Actinoplanes couchii]
MLAAFSTTYAAGLVTGGVLGDRYGTRRLFRAGAAGYLVGCVVCALAPGPAVLVGGRALQGLAAAAMVPQAFALTAIAGPAAYHRLAAVLGAASVTGQLAAVVSGGSWRVLFVIQAAATVVMLVRPGRFPPAAGGRGDVAGLVLGILVPLSVLGPLVVVRLTGGPAWILLGTVAVAPLGWAYRRRGRAVFAGRAAVLAASGTGVAYACQAVLLLLTALRPDVHPLVPVGYGAAFALFSVLRRPVVLAAVAVPALILTVAAGYPGGLLVVCGAAMGVVLPRLTATALTGSVPGAAAGTLATIPQFAAAAALTVSAGVL